MNICVNCGYVDPCFWRTDKDPERQYTETEKLELELPNPYYLYRIKNTGTHVERMSYEIYSTRIQLLTSSSLKPSVESHAFVKRRKNKQLKLV